MPRKTTHVAIVDDSPFDRKLLSSYLGHFKNCKIILQFMNGKDLLDNLHLQKIDVIILDLYMPCLDGMETLYYLRERKFNDKVLVVSGSYEPEKIPILKGKGASGYSSKLKHHFIIAFQNILRGNLFFDETIPKNIVDEFSFHEVDFTGTDLEILLLFAQGMKYDEIADELKYLQPRTVETYLLNMVHRNGFKNPIQMITYCCRTGIISNFDDQKIQPQT